MKKGEKVISVNYLKPFTHGEEGTHTCCDKRIKDEGGKARCCYCSPHNDCGLNLKCERCGKSDNHVDSFYIKNRTFFFCLNCELDFWDMFKVWMKTKQLKVK